MNPYARFVDLLPKVATWIGMIQSVNTTTNIAVVEVPGSNSAVQVKCTGSYAANDYVFISDGVVLSKLPPFQSLLQISIP